MKMCENDVQMSETNPTMKMYSTIKMCEINPNMKMFGSAMNMCKMNPASSLETNTETSNPMLSSSEGGFALIAPTMINLSTSGLRRSPCLQEQANTSNSDKGPSTVAYTSGSKNMHPVQRPKRQTSRISFFSVFSSVGVLWSSASSTMPHFFNGECHFFVTRFSDESMNA